VGLRIDEVFRDLDSEALEAFQALQARSFHPAQSMLFAEGQTAAGVFSLRAGKVRLFMSGPAGERLTSRTAQPGEILGVTEGVSGDSYKMSAETLAASEVGFINREAFLQFLCAHGVVAFRLVQLLSNQVDSSYEQLRSLAVSRSRKLKR
jgi:CRP/FNR family transcriptional regulator